MTTPSRTDRQELTEPQTVFADKLLRARDELAAEPGLSAEQVEEMRRGLLADAFWSEQQDEDHWSDERINTLCDMALRSLTTRDEGIEAAAKLIRKRLDGIYEDHSYTEQDTGAVVIDNAEIEGRANELEELEEEIRALAQDQRSEQSSGLNGDVSSVSPRSSSSAPNGVERTGNSASIDTVTGRRDGHPTEQDAAELLREALDAYDHIVVKTGYQGDFDTSAGRAHLALKEGK